MGRPGTAGTLPDAVGTLDVGLLAGVRSRLDVLHLRWETNDRREVALVGRRTAGECSREPGTHTRARRCRQLAGRLVIRHSLRSAK